MSQSGLAGEAGGGSGSGSEGKGTADLRSLAPALPRRIDAVPDGASRDLGRLVLTLVEFLRQVLEHQAVRRLEAGSLTEEEEERLGLALFRLQEQVQELKRVFELDDEDLNVDLGPLGRLL